MTEKFFPVDLTVAVEKHFSEVDRPRAFEILADYAHRFAILKDLERVRVDMVIVSRGNVAKLARQAERDYRDVIMDAEYEIREGKVVRRAALD